ncbi:DUF4003 family protein [Metasolibacillus meyeri]|uniref:DUF4003 family protein n=1 Tax=Metasolibacillus meyeri TaxID=1071052 RepID=UPI000D30F922|nr:DUF4003 family protein [Metasolibacillus meyeri]
MEQILQQFEQNYKKIEKLAGWAVGKPIILLMASYYTARQQEVNIDELQEAIAVIKQETGFFSTLRTNVLIQYVYAMQLAGESDKKEAIHELLSNAEILRKVKFANISYTTIAALFLTGENKEQQAQRAQLIYQEMRKKHKFLTSYDDVPIAVLFALDDVDIELRVQTMRRYYDELKAEKFTQGNELQALSQILTTVSIDYNEQIVPYIVAIKQQLEQAKIKVRSAFYVQLGFLVLAKINDEQLQQVIELYELFESQKYLKWYKNQAFSIAVQQYLPKRSLDANELLSVVSMELLLQMQYAIMATTTVVAVSTSSSSD